MTEKIKNMLVDLSIESYLITEISEESEELYFIKKRLDVKRSKNVKKTTLTVLVNNDILSDREISAKLVMLVYSLDKSLTFFTCHLIHLTLFERR